MCSSNWMVRADATPEDPGRRRSGVAEPSRPAVERGSALRASDAERDAAAVELRTHAAAGRLDVEELEARLDAVLSARTRGDVAGALSDLPVLPPANRRATPPARGTPERELRAYTAVMLLLLAIWLITGAGHFWPIYPALGWGLPLVLGRSHARRRRPAAAP